MFQSDIKAIERKGVITLIPCIIAGVKYYRGDRLADACALVSVIGKSRFPISEYDYVLYKASEQWGVGLEVIGE